MPDYTRVQTNKKEDSEMREREREREREQPVAARKQIIKKPRKKETYTQNPEKDLKNGDASV
jgi:hypothetical protein